jgi:hypothetical protein
LLLAGILFLGARPLLLHKGRGPQVLQQWGKDHGGDEGQGEGDVELLRAAMGDEEDAEGED